MKELYIIGGGGFSKQVIEIIEDLNIIEKKYQLIGIIDDNTELIGKKILGYEIVGNVKHLEDISNVRDVYAVIAIGNGKVRESIYNKLHNIKWINLIHPKTIISRYAAIGNGNIICGGVIINPECEIGNHCNINIGSTLGHDVTLEDYTTLMPGCHISGYVNVKKHSTIGTGSSIIQGLKIAENTYIGAGASVVKNTEANSIYTGVPARKLRNNE